MLKIFSLLSIISSFAFAQYIPKATITSKETNKSYDIRDVQFFSNGKMLRFKLKEFNNMYAYIRLKNFDLKYDDSQLQKTVPVLRDIYYQNDLGYPDGAYKTKEDFVNKNPLDKNFEMKTNMAIDYFENPNDLVNFYDLQGKFPEYQQRDYFAVVKNGDVYFNIKDLKKSSRLLKVPLAQEIPNFAYVRVKGGTEKSLYFELPKSINNSNSLIMFGAVGAIASVIIDNNQHKKTSETPSEVFTNYVSEGIILPNTDLFKGVVFDTASKDFKILTFCDDLNAYLHQNSSELSVDCQKEYLLDKQREIISKL